MPENEFQELHASGFLESLLSDRTSRRRIIWATETLRDLGIGREDEITPAFLCAHAGELGEIRHGKRVERARKHGEVLTPLHICDKMCAHAEQTLKGSDWRKFVTAKVLEITCGEAPFLVSRRDPATGEIVPLNERVGLLDRKLRIVSEKAKDDKEWLEWLYRAFQSVYGYEFQGYNLLLARVNMLRTFEECLMARLGRMPAQEEVRRILNIIVWNIWQMDGLTGTLPYRKLAPKAQSLSLFGGGAGEGFFRSCLIYDWQANKTCEFRDLEK